MAGILIIDDDPWVRETLRATLEHLGHDIIEAEDGETGIALAEGAPIEAVLLDARLPRLRVEEVLAGIQQTGRGLPVLVVTGLPKEALAPALFAERGVGYLRKPFLPLDLARELERLGVSSRL